MTVDTFEAFYRDTKDACFRALVVAVGDADEAGDLLAESFARAWARWESVSSHPAPAAWVIRTAVNLHRDRWRRRRLTRRLSGPSDHVAPPDLPVDESLLDALWSLPRRQREVIALRVLLDFDTDRTGEVLGITSGTVTAHLHRGLSKLRDELVMEDLK